MYSGHFNCVQHLPFYHAGISLAFMIYPGWSDESVSGRLEFSIISFLYFSPFFFDRLAMEH